MRENIQSDKGLVFEVHKELYQHNKKKKMTKLNCGQETWIDTSQTNINKGPIHKWGGNAEITSNQGNPN